MGSRGGGASPQPPPNLPEGRLSAAKKLSPSGEMERGLGLAPASDWSQAQRQTAEHLTLPTLPKLHPTST